jgi:hypothetical protein
MKEMKGKEEKKLNGNKEDPIFLSSMSVKITGSS